MRSLVALFFLTCASLSANAQSQHPIDRYLGRQPVTELIADAGDRVLTPQDLDFCRVPGRERELWLVNRNGSVIIVYDAGTPTQWSEYRRDSHSGHFMQRPTGIAMGANGNFGTSPESPYEDIGQVFMGPVLWTSDTSIFARIHQNDDYLGSHSDMLHESQFAMGIAADTGNVYWVFDGYHEAIYRYDFAEPHGYGEDDHSDGVIHGYFVGLARTEALPSHLVLEDKTGWLYVNDNGNNRILRMQTRSGEYGEDLTDAMEPLVEYGTIENATTETFETGIDGLCGIDIWEDRLIVSVNGTGELRIYNTSVTPPAYLGSIQTGSVGIMGVKVGPDSAIWYVDQRGNKVVRITPGEPLTVHQQQDAQNAVHLSVEGSALFVSLQQRTTEIRIVNALGQTVRSIQDPQLSTSVHIGDLANGVYFCQVISNGVINVKKFVVK